MFHRAAHYPPPLTTQAALAGHLLEATTVIPIHHGGFESDPYYHENLQAYARFAEAAGSCDYRMVSLAVGESVRV